MLSVEFQTKSWETTGGYKKSRNTKLRTILYIGLLKQQCYNNHRKESFKKIQVSTVVLLKMQIVWDLTVPLAITCAKTDCNIPEHNGSQRIISLRKLRHSSGK